MNSKVWLYVGQIYSKLYSGSALIVLDKEKIT
jgi:hypothetical protein